MDTSKAFVIEPAVNGGVVVRLPCDVSRGPLVMPEFTGAFTTPADMIAWLAEQYGLQSHPTPIVRAGETAGESLIPVRHVKEVAPKTTFDGWVPWSGGERPVSRDTAVEIKVRSGETNGEMRADYWVWLHRKLPSDIVAYRVVADKPSVAAAITEHNNRRG